MYVYTKNKSPIKDKYILKTKHGLPSGLFVIYGSEAKLILLKLTICYK